MFFHFRFMFLFTYCALPESNRPTAVAHPSVRRERFTSSYFRHSDPQLLQRALDPDGRSLASLNPENQNLISGSFPAMMSICQFASACLTVSLSSAWIISCMILHFSL